MALLNFGGADDPTDPSWAMGAGQPPALPPAADPSIMDKILNAIRWTESRGNPNAVSPAGAVGPYQIMPKTAANPGYGVPPLAPDQLNQEGPARKFAGDYIKALYAKLGSWPAAFAAYNGGMKQGLNFNAGAPMPAETANYVPAVQNALAKGLGAPTQDAGTPAASPMAVGYDAATDGPGGATPPVAPPATAPVPQNVGTDGGTGAGMPQVSDTPLPAAKPAVAAPQQQASISGSSMPPSMQEYMRAMSGGGDTTMGRIGDALMAIGAGMPGNRGTATALLEMAQRRKERMLELQEKMYPQMMTYNALYNRYSKAGVPDAANKAMLEAFGGDKGEVVKTGTSMMGGDTYQLFHPISGTFESIPTPGAQGAATAAGAGAASGPNEPPTDEKGQIVSGQPYLSYLSTQDPKYAELVKTAGDWGEDIYKMKLPRTPGFMNNFIVDIKRYNPDWDPSKFEAIQKVRDQLMNTSANSPGGNVMAMDKSSQHLNDALENFDAMNKVGGGPFEHGGPFNSWLNSARISYLQHSQNPETSQLATSTLAGATEMAKFLRGIGAIGENEEKQWADKISAAYTPEQQQAVFAELGKLANGQLQAYVTKYNEMPESYRKLHPVTEFLKLSPETMKFFKRIGVQPATTSDDEWAAMNAPPPAPKGVDPKEWPIIWQHMSPEVRSKWPTS